MRGWRPLALIAGVALVGALGTLAAGAASGMGPGDLTHLALLLAPAAIATIVAMAIAGPLLSRVSIRQRIVAVAVVGAAVALGNLAVVFLQMFVSDHDATVMAVLLLYSLGAGIGAALVVARSSSAAIDRLAGSARALGEGDLDTRVGRLDAGPELDTLGRTLDEMAERLQTALERERGIETTRRDLMTAVSHDLRTPLASLRAMTEAIDEGVVEDPPSLRRYAVEMRRAVDSLVALVDDLFELAQLDAGAIEAETERVRFEDVVHSAMAACEAQASDKGLVLQADIGASADALCSPRLVRVLQNLLANAIRHTPADGAVRIEAARKVSVLELAVEDTGQGIAPEDLEHVFDPFWRGDPARSGASSGAGAGLGLTLAKRIVEALGGSIEAQSRPLVKGARFEVLVPVGGSAGGA
ncbi:MAG: HAMP domain-containing sensor histidine kinase [Actinomycetota bacterium]